MNNFIVTIPVAGYYEIEVEALDAEDAVEQAFQRVDNFADDRLVELDGYRHITRGNVLYAPINSAHAVLA